MAVQFYYLIIGLMIFGFVLDQLLDFLNTKGWKLGIPASLKEVYPAEKYQKTILYEKENYRFGLLQASLSFAGMLIFLIFGGFGWLDGIIHSYTNSMILRALLFFGVLAFVSDLVSTPFSAWHTFVIEQKFGFNTTTLKTFILDKLKGLLLMVLIGGGLLSLIVYIYSVTGDWFWVLVWASVSGFSIFMAMFYSDIIVPLFNKQTPLEQGVLRDSIEAFATKVGFKLKNIYVIDGSKRSNKANAYFTGLGSRKRIVLYDTLIKDHTTEELVAVLAHEVGHYKHRHTLKGIVSGLLQAGFMFYILSLFIQKDSQIALAISQAIAGNQLDTPASFHLGILAFSVLYSPVSMITGLVSNWFSRKHEYQADRYAAENYGAKPLQSALIKLSANNLSNLNPHPWYVFVHYSHPPLVKRLEALGLMN
jgi:STE24 endopeptidase